MDFFLSKSWASSAPAAAPIVPPVGFSLSQTKKSAELHLAYTILTVQQNVHSATGEGAQQLRMYYVHEILVKFAIVSRFICMKENMENIANLI